MQQLFDAQKDVSSRLIRQLEETITRWVVGGFLQQTQPPLILRLHDSALRKMDEYESQIAVLKQQIASMEKEFARNERHCNQALDQITECHVGVELSSLLSYSCLAV